MIEWWTEQQAGLIGGIGGSLIGVIGGGLGSFMGVCAPRGVLKAPVIGVQLFIAAAGACTLAVGGYANLTGQPYHVYFPLMLGGSICLGVLGGLLPMTLWAYHAAAVRKQSGVDSTPGADFRAPHSAVIRAIADNWGVGGAFRAFSLKVAWAMLLVALAAAGVGVTLALRGAPLGSWFAWCWAAFGPATAAVICWLLPRIQLSGANNARLVLDQQRLAAEELRRG